MSVIDLKTGKKRKKASGSGGSGNGGDNDNNNPTKVLEKAGILSEALPFIKRFAGEVFVIKFGGSAMGDPEIIAKFARDIVLLKKIGINPIVVHGGGPQIGQMLDRLKIKSEFVDGLRVTDAAVVEIVEMVLSGSINKNIVKSINDAGGLAVGLSGKDANLIEAKKIRKTVKDTDSNIEKILDLGFVGEPTHINPEIFLALEESEIIPVIAPIGVGRDGQTFNINADLAAGKLASAINASKLIMLSDVDGVLDKKENLISQMSLEEADSLIQKKVIKGGMIPKVTTCMSAVANGVQNAHILNGKVPHILLVEVFTENGAGTMFSLE